METILGSNSRHETQSLISLEKYSDSLPLDLLMEIFSRVPSKSVVRFYYLSKFWASILRRPYFTDLFLTKSSTRPQLLFTFRIDNKFFFFSTPQLQNPNENLSIVATFHHVYVSKIILPFLSICRMSLSCGFVFLEETGKRDKMRVIINPITRKSIELPKLKGKNSTMMFGYDPIGKQFKVLAMYYSRWKRLYTHRILTLETEKCLWRDIKCNSHCPKDDTICINGLLYYRTEFEESLMLVCFEVRSEKFLFIKIQEDMLLMPSMRYTNYKGKLGVYHYCYYTKTLELWILEDATKPKWSKSIFVIPHLELGDETVSCEILLSPWYTTNPFIIVYYNLEKNTIAKINIQGFEDFENLECETFTNYVESIKLM